MKVYIQAIPDRRPYVQMVMIPSLQWADDVAVSVDWDCVGPLYGALKIWEAVAGGSEPAMILQDDVLIHRQLADFIPLFKMMLKSKMKAISLFAPPRRAYLEAYNEGYNFIENYNFLWLQGVIFTPEFCKGLVDYSKQTDTIHDDVAVREYCRKSRTPVWQTLPSLIQHDLNVKSSMGHNRAIGGMKRRTQVWEKCIDENAFLLINSKRLER